MDINYYLNLAVEQLLAEKAIVKVKHAHLKRFGFRLPEEKYQDIFWKSEMSTGAAETIVARSIELETGSNYVGQFQVGSKSAHGFMRRRVDITPEFWASKFPTSEAAQISACSSVAIFQLHASGIANVYTDNNGASYYFDLPHQYGNVSEPSDAYIERVEEKCAEIESLVKAGYLDLTTIIEERSSPTGIVYAFQKSFLSENA